MRIGIPYGVEVDHSRWAKVDFGAEWREVAGAKTEQKRKLEYTQLERIAMKIDQQLSLQDACRQQGTRSEETRRDAGLE